MRTLAPRKFAIALILLFEASVCRADSWAELARASGNYFMAIAVMEYSQKRYCPTMAIVGSFSSEVDRFSKKLPSQYRSKYYSDLTEQQSFFFSNAKAKVDDLIAGRKADVSVQRVCDVTYGWASGTLQSNEVAFNRIVSQLK